MSVPVKFAGDLTDLPTHAYGHRSLTWWGVVAFFLIEGTGFALAIATYFYLMGGEQNWPPSRFQPPGLLAGPLFTIVILLSEIPNTLIKRAAERKHLGNVRSLMLIMIGISLVLALLRAWEFTMLNVWWTDNAYGSILWALLFLHATHFITDFADTIVLGALMFTRHSAEDRRLVDVAENAMYWRFVWLTWLPIYVLIYWVPRWAA
jgi:heme/copper-type cytochrome/quinol oxidase subunit 3